MDQWLSILGRKCRYAGNMMTVWCENEQIQMSRYHCNRLICDDCYPDIITRRVRALKYYLKEFNIEKLWVGLLTTAELHRLHSTRFKREHWQIAQATATYVDIESKGVVVSSLQPLVKLPLKEMLTNDALQVWLDLALQHRVKKMRSDWPTKIPTSTQWLLQGDLEDVVEALRRAGVTVAEHVDNPLELSAKLLRLHHGIKEGEDSDDSDLYGTT